MMTRELERRLAEATEIAKQARHEFVTLEHVLLSVSAMPNLVEILEACGVDVQALRKNLREYLKKVPQIPDEQLDSYGGFEAWTPEFTLACHRLFQRAALQVRSAGRNQVNEATLLVSLFYEQDSHAVYALTRQGLTQFDIINYVSHGVGKDDDSEMSAGPAGAAVDAPESSEARKSALEEFCVNLNERAKSGRIDPLIGRDQVLERVAQVLLRRTKNNPLLIGEPGVGKTAIAEGLAAKIVHGDV
ncbi:MAG TPA: Clp protease N-terminal domain-containing protein, partial [Pseudobdellovibrionaceae bacterium]|nr:Clp protease N-terminal domain-containing protein [Pseudobdellovibrionaceae bacterium]